MIINGTLSDPLHTIPPQLDGQNTFKHDEGYLLMVPKPYRDTKISTMLENYKAVKK